MGLDHGLKATVRLWNHNPKEKELLDLIGPIVKKAGLDMNVDGVVFDILTLRKVNAVHSWFVKNAQGGTDDCGTYYIPTEQLKELKEACTKAMFGDYESLPTESGFFFGSTDYDEWYIQGLRDTINAIDKVILLEEKSGFTLAVEYWSSW